MKNKRDAKRKPKGKIRLISQAGTAVTTDPSTKGVEVVTTKVSR